MPEGTVGPLYCSEQIRIPEKLPEIMKNYCKAAIKTQPYDILKWSTAYFRSLADDLPPVMKTCLEKETRTKYLTKGCLRMFIEHLGKGFFVHRRILKKLWEKVLPLVFNFKNFYYPIDENLILNEFYKVISLGRMLYWRELHWLKLIGIMAGWLSKDLRSTMILICDLLTNELEGGVSSIPIWMFLTIYKYLAELDCSTEQRIVNSRRQLEDGTVEELIEPNELPYIMSATSLNKCLIESCVDNDEQCSQSNSSYENDFLTADFRSFDNMEKQKWLQDFKMHGKIADPARIFKRCQNFDTLIFYIKTHQIKNQCQVIQGPHYIKAKTASKARDKDYEAAITREQFDTMYKESVAYEEAFQDKIDIIKDSGPPWSWVFDFTACSGYDKSFNYLDNISILSDKTPDTSSDESFDFLTEKPITNCVNVYKPETSSLASASTYQSSCDEKNVSELLLSRSKDFMPKSISSVIIHDSDISLKKKDTKNDADQTTTQLSKKPQLYQFEAVVNEFESLLQEKHFEYESSDDANSYLPNLETILKQAGDKSDYSFEYMYIVDIIKIAMRQEIKFNTLDEILKYIRAEYNKWFKKEDENKKPDETCAHTETDTDTDRNWVINENVSQVFDESASKAYNYGVGDYQGSHADQRECKEDNKPKQIDTPPQPKTTVPQEEKPKRNIENTFGDDITMDQKVKTRKVQKDMILGLVSGDSEPDETTSINNSSSSIISDPPKCIDKTGYYSDDSSIFPKPTVEKDKRIKFQEYKQTCELPREHEKIYDYKIPPLPGIGGIVPYKVMCKFMEFIKFCAYKQQGMVFKSNLLEEKCPPLEDLLQFTIDKMTEHKIQQETVECDDKKVEIIEERCPEP